MGPRKKKKKKKALPKGLYVYRAGSGLVASCSRATDDAQLRTFYRQAVEDWIRPNQCAYCGDLACTVDHVPALSVAHLYDRSQYLLYPCCAHCNAVLGATIGGFRYRAQVLIEALIRKAGAIGVANWTAEEIRSLGPNMRSMVRARLAKRNDLVERITHIRLILDLTEGDPGL